MFSFRVSSFSGLYLMHLTGADVERKEVMPPSGKPLANSIIRRSGITMLRETFPVSVTLEISCNSTGSRFVLWWTEGPINANSLHLEEKKINIMA